MPIRPDFIYDAWAIVNFPREYAEKGRYLEPADDLLVKPLVNHFAELEIDKLPHCFAHGDLIATNVMKDKTGALWIVDFAVSNYYPRIQELAVLACNLCFDETDADQSRNKGRVLLETYQKAVPLTITELKAAPTYVRLAHAMHLLEANYERIAGGNDTLENAYWFRQGRAGLLQSLPV
jgi:Ser/Thr protein kinase RdoA (MazF antagonist)